MNLPEDYTAYDGKGCPVDPDDYVDLIIRTAEGLGHSGIMRAKLHDWEQDEPDGLGHVVGYRLAERGEPLPDGHLTKRWA